MKSNTQPNIIITPPRKRYARLPRVLVSNLKLFEVAAVENDSETYLAPDEDCPRSRRVPMLGVYLGGDSELVSRVAALLLLQSGGRSFLQPSLNFGGTLGLVYLLAGTHVELY